MSMSSTRIWRFACNSLASAFYKYMASLCPHHPSRENIAQSIVNMAMSKSAFLVLIFSLLLSFGLLCSAARKEQDPREQLERCQRRCEGKTHSHREQRQCEQQCERQFKEQQEQEERERGRGVKPEDPQRKFEECQQQCEQQEQGQREQQQCQRECRQQFEKEQREQQEETQRQLQQCQERCQEQEQGQKQQQQCQRQCREQYEEQGRDAYEENPQSHKKGWNEEEEEEEEEEGRQRKNPYFFPSRRSFQTRFRDEEGRFNVLQRFAQKSPLLKGINDYRFALFEANPHTFILPHHCDSEAIYFVTKGRGIITFVNHENKESYNVKFGTVLRVPAGSTVYMVNQDNNEKLRIAVFAQPINAPGKFVEFFPVGNGNPSSYIQVFDDRLLETVFNTPRERLEKVFQSQREQPGQRRQQGVFRRVEPEQIRSMSQQATSPGRGKERLAINLISQSPAYSNQNGRFYEASPEDFKQLQNMDVAVSACEIKEEAIFVPHFNSKATYVVFVTEGNGYVEMACPHLSQRSQQRSRRESEQEEEEEEEEQSRGEYQKVRAQLSAGDVFVVPAGHPVTFVASRNQNLRTIGFGINAENNQRIFVAGKNNLFRQMDSEAKQISFGAPSRLVDEVFNNPKESYFMSFSQGRQREDMRGSPLASFLDITRLF